MELCRLLVLCGTRVLVLLDDVVLLLPVGDILADDKPVFDCCCGWNFGCRSCADRPFVDVGVNMFLSRARSLSDRKCFNERVAPIVEGGGGGGAK